MQNESLAQAIVDGTQKTKKVIVDLKHALVESNPTYLKGYIKELQKYKQDVETLLGSAPLSVEPRAATP